MDDNAAYDMLDPSFGMNLGLMYRFGPTVALQMNYLIGLYDTPSGAGSPYGRFMALGVGPRFFVPAGMNEKDYNYNGNAVLQQAIEVGARGAYWDILRKISRA